MPSAGEAGAPSRSRSHDRYSPAGLLPNSSTCAKGRSSLEDRCSSVELDVSTCRFPMHKFCQLAAQSYPAGPYASGNSVSLLPAVDWRQTASSGRMLPLPQDRVRPKAAFRLVVRLDRVPNDLLPMPTLPTGPTRQGSADFDTRPGTRDLTVLCRFRSVDRE